MAALTETAEQLKRKLLALPVRDRAELAHFLIRSLDNGEPEKRGAPRTPKPVQGMATRRATREGHPSVTLSTRELREKYTAKLREAYAAASAQSLLIAEEWQAVDRELDNRLDELEASS